MNAIQPLRLSDRIDIFEAPYDTWAPEEIFAYLQTRNTVRYFPVIDEAQVTENKLDKILLNRFDFNDESYQLRAEFDWTVNPSSDIEWLILLHKFYYAAGFGRAYDKTKDARYADKWIELTCRWIDTVPVDFLSSDVTGRRIQNWIFAHYYFVTLNRTPGLSAAFYHKFLVSLYQQVNYLIEHLTPARNHRTLELYGVFLAAVVFPELKGSDRWLAFSTDELLKNMHTDLLDDGVHCELSTDYHHIVLRNYLGVRRLALINHIRLPAEMDAHIKKALEFCLYAHKPDGRIPAISDGDPGSFLYLLEQGHALYGSEEMLYVASKGTKGKAPSQRSKGFDASGYYILRSGWGEGAEPYEDERYLFFDCAPLGAGSHGHLDLLSFEMAAYGQSLIVDPGRYTYDESGDANWRVLFRGTSYHNTVLVDRKNQTRYEFHKEKFKIKGPEPAHELKAFISRPGFDYLHGIARSHEYPVVHERKIFFLCPEYWVICDVLRAHETHDYDLLFHLSEHAFGKVTVSRDGQSSCVDAPHLVLVQPTVAGITPCVDAAYVSPTYGVKHRAPIVKYAQHAANAIYHTILYPYKQGRPAISVAAVPVLSNGRTCLPTEASALRIEIRRDGQEYRDLIALAHQAGREYQVEHFVSTGAFLFVRHDDNGRIIMCHEEHGSKISA